MNYTTAVFLINNKVRGVVGTYETDKNAQRTVFKTLDQSIKVDDIVVVPTTTRHGMTVIKIVEVDIDVDMDSAVPLNWVVSKLDQDAYKQTLAQEADAVQQIKSAEMRQKRDNLRNALFKDQMETLKALPIAALNGD